MPRKHLLLLPFITAGLLMTSTPGAALTPAGVNVATADNAFGFRLLNAVQKTAPHGNVVLSPLSAALDLSMALNGADGQTKQEMLTALSLGGSELDAINSANEQLIKVIRTPSRGITLSVADSLWVDSHRATLSPDYVQRVQTAYDAEIANIDFSLPGALPRINSWVAQNTQQKIPKIIDRIDPADVALLINAVYFKGQWQRKFDKARTQQHDFTRADGTTKQVWRMAQSGRFEYFETPELQAVRLPFGDGDLVMQVLLPAQTSSLEALEAKLTAEQWAAWDSQYVSRPGALELPRFELKLHYRLNGPLQTLGMKRAFEAHGAELSGLFSQAPDHRQAASFFISVVLQSTYWKVDEEGSEAAAATAIGIRAAAIARPVQPFQMIVDRPFLCTIEDRRSGALLFVGALYDPSG